MIPKPFDLEKAKAGAPVVCERHPSRNHVPARILCFDALGQNPIVALVANEDGETETAVRLNLSGISAYYTLFMAPVKRTGWIVIQPVRGAYGTYYAEMLHGEWAGAGRVPGTIIFETEESARGAYIGIEEWAGYQIAKVEWEE